MRTFALIASLAAFAAAQDGDAAVEIENTIFDGETPFVISEQDGAAAETEEAMVMDVDMDGDMDMNDWDGMDGHDDMGMWDDKDMDEQEMQAMDALKMAKDLMDIFCGEEMDDTWEMDNDEKWEEDNDMVMEGGEGRRLQEEEWNGEMLGADENTWSPTWDENGDPVWGGDGEMLGADENTWSPTWDENGNPVWGGDEEEMGMWGDSMMKNDTMMDMDDLCMQARALWNEANEYHMADEQGRKEMEDAWSSAIEMEIKAWFEGATAITASAAVVAAVATLAF